MKKILSAVVFLFAVTASGAFGQTTEDEWFNKAGEYFGSGDYTNAIKAYSETIKRNSSNLDAYWLRGVAYYQTKNYDAAIADCTAVIKGAPDFPDVYVARGDAYGAKGIYHKAAADYKTGLEKGYDPGTFNVDKSSKADMWFCGAIYMEIVVNRFRGNSAAVTKYENWLKTVSGRNGVSSAEIKSYFEQGIGALVAETVDAQFNRVSFPLYRYDAVLTRTSNNQYILSYKDVNDVVKELSAVSLETLLSEMRNGKNKTDFTSADLNTVRAQAALIPAVVLAQSGQTEAVQGTVAKALTDFYLEPTLARYNVVKDIDVFFIRRAYEFSNDPFFAVLSQTYGRLLVNLSKPISEKISSDTRVLPSVLSLTQAQMDALTVKR